MLKVLSLQAYPLFLAKVCPNRECQPGRPCIRRPDRRQSQGALVQAGGEASFSGTVVSLHNKVSIGRAEIFFVFCRFQISGLQETAEVEFLEELGLVADAQKFKRLHVQANTKLLYAQQK